MFRFPDGFIKIQYPGYAWNIEEKKLYSFKGGTLREMKLSAGYRGVSRWTGKSIDAPAGYKISHNGHHRTVPLKQLMSMKAPKKDQFVEYKE